MMQNDYTKNINSWNEYIEEYSQNSKFSKNEIHLGLGLSGLTSDKIVKDAKSILDVGCGNGINSFIMASNAISIVDAIDVGHNIISENEKLKANNLHFIKSDFASYAASCNKKYDLLTFFGSIDYIALDEIFFRDLNRITKENSRCFISKFHPFWTTLFNGDTEEMSIKNYFSDRIDPVHYGQKKCVELFRFHYSLSTFINLFEANGWEMIYFDEPKIDIKKSAFAYSNYETDEVLINRMKNIPMTMLIEFRQSLKRM